MNKIKIDAECDMIESVRLWIFALATSVPIFIYSIGRCIILMKHPDLDHVVPVFVFWIIVVVIIGLAFIMFKHLRVIYYVYVILKQIISTGTDTYYLTDMKVLFKCKEAKAKRIVEEMLDGGYFPELYFDSISGVLFFTKEKTDIYRELVTGTNGQRLSPEAIRSRVEISRIQSASNELKAAIKEYKEAGIKDKRIKNAMNKVVDMLDKIPKAMTFNMSNNIDVHKLHTYYIPTLCKLIRGYCNYSDVTISDTRQLRENLIGWLDSTYNMLIEICTSINKNDEMDLMVEMSTMKAVMSADGYGRLDVDVRKDM